VAEYTLAEVAKIFRISPARLRYWERTALVPASPGDGDQPTFGFRDLVCIRTVLALLQHGVPLRRIRRSVTSLRERIPELEQPLGSLRVWVEGSDRVVARLGDALLDPDGQLLLDFRLAPPVAEDVAVLHPRRDEDGPDREAALEHFERGCQLDSEPSRHAAAIEAYERAIAADPDFADAHSNLGTVHHVRGDLEQARACYERALGVDPGHVEARFNLASLLEELGRDEAALRHYKAALLADPFHADAQLNLALLYERLGLRRTARDHWRRYLQLAPEGAWAEVARERLSAG
jgi:tetratricopeptide (TPR) repeat protein